jgi:NitT/TauT family transport system substrate-binding protein
MTFVRGRAVPLVTSMLLCAAVLGAPMAAAQADKTPIRVANLDIGPFTPVAYVAKLAGKHGITVQITGFRRGLEAAQALKAGEADVAVGGVEAAVTAIAGGAPAVIVSSVSTGGIAWVGRSDLDLKKVTDLKGKKFAVIRGLHELVMRVEFEQSGLTYSTEPGSDVQVVFINSPPALNTALKAHDVDAMSAPEPFPSRAIVEGYAKPLLRPYDTPLGNMPRAVFMRVDFLKAHPDVAQRFVDALVEATMTFRDNPAVARDFVVNDALKGAITAQDWEMAMKNQTFDVTLTANTVQHYVDYMLKFGMIKAPLKSADITDLSMLDKAMAKAHWTK